MRIGSVYPIRRLALITGALASNQREHPLPLWGFIAEQTPRVVIRHQKRGASARWFGPTRNVEITIAMHDPPLYTRNW